LLVLIVGSTLEGSEQTPFSKENSELTLPFSKELKRQYWALFLSFKG